MSTIKISGRMAHRTYKASIREADDPRIETKEESGVAARNKGSEAEKEAVKQGCSRHIQSFACSRSVFVMFL